MTSHALLFIQPCNNAGGPYEINETDIETRENNWCMLSCNFDVCAYLLEYILFEWCNFGLHSIFFPSMFD